MDEEHEKKENQRVKSKEVPSLFLTNVIAVLPWYYRIQQFTVRNMLFPKSQKNVEVWQKMAAKDSVLLGWITVNYFWAC